MGFPFCFLCYILFYLRQPFIEEKSDFNSIQNSIFKSTNQWIVSYICDCICHSVVCCEFVLVVWLRDVFDSGQLTCFWLLITLTGYIYILHYYIYARVLKTLSSICSVSLYGAFFGGEYYELVVVDN